jgi:hypothetical protein
MDAVVNSSVNSGVNSGIISKLAISGDVDVWSRIASLRQNSLDLLAPAMRAAVVAVLKRAHGRVVHVTLSSGLVDVAPLDPVVFETLRSDELQRIYYAEGTTNAPTAETSWHFYGLAIDTISIEYEWFDNAAARKRWPLERDRETVSDAWFRAMAEIGKQLELDAGIDWPTRPDAPHLQWGRCSASPHDAPGIYHTAGCGLRGRQEVWKAVGALFIPPELAAAAA